MQSVIIREPQLSDEKHFLEAMQRSELESFLKILYRSFRVL